MLNMAPTAMATPAAQTAVRNGRRRHSVKDKRSQVIPVWSRWLVAGATLARLDRAQRLRRLKVPAARSESLPLMKSIAAHRLERAAAILWQLLRSMDPRQRQWQFRRARRAESTGSLRQ